MTTRTAFTALDGTKSRESLLQSGSNPEYHERRERADGSFGVAGSRSHYVHQCGAGSGDQIQLKQASLPSSVHPAVYTAKIISIDPLVTSKHIGTSQPIEAGRQHLYEKTTHA